MCLFLLLMIAAAAGLSVGVALTLLWGPVVGVLAAPIAASLAALATGIARAYAGRSAVSGARRGRTVRR